MLPLIAQGDKIHGSFLNTNVEDNSIRAYEQALFNGFTTYYRFLLCSTIYNNRLIRELDKINELNLDKIKKLLQTFNCIFTTNYDLLLENILTDTNVIHLHGQFIFNTKEYCYHQSLSLKINTDWVSFSDILVGDYFVNKISRPTISVLASKRYKENKELHYIGDMIENKIKEEKINTFIIFDLNIDNDQHILRSLMGSFYFQKVKNPKIIFSYFNENDKKIFIEQFKKCITFNDSMNDYCNNFYK